MELRHLRYFVAVADDGHVHRAAARLGIAQPALTQQIKALEREVGARLLVRAGRGIALSEAGCAFHIEARAILAHVERAAAMARRLEAGEAGLLRVGFTESSSYHPIVAEILKRFRAAWPAVECRLEEKHTEGLSDALLAGEIDAAFVRPPLRAPGNLTLMPLVSETMVAALPPSHRLADRNELQIDDLAGEAFVVYPRRGGAGLSDAVLAECRRAGFAPHIAQEAPQLSATVNLVAAGMGVAVVPGCMRHQRPDSVHFVPLTNLDLRAQLGLAHRQDSTSRLVANLLVTAVDALSTSPTADGKHRGIRLSHVSAEAI